MLDIDYIVYLIKLQTDAKGKKILLNDLNQSNKERSSTEHYAMASSSYNQEKLDEM